jgi:GT2 family glycosyltransferase
LASVAASLYSEVELLILDEGAEYETGPAMRFLHDQPSLPAMLLHQPTECVAHARNILAERARGEYVFILDPDCGIYPSALERLVKALDSQPQAIFSYPMVGVFDGAEPIELASSLPWEPERLTRGNWIDAMALIRRGPLLKLGGYTTDPRLAGWEEYDLWCKCAQAGGFAVHVPEVLAWRRRGAPAATPEMWRLMRERFPQLLAVPSRL